MSDGPDSLVLRYLVSIEAKVDGMLRTLDDFLSRPSPIAHMLTDKDVPSAVSVRMDSMDRRLERIERRLDLVEDHP